MEYTTANLETGMTEKHVRALMRDWPNTHGVEDPFRDPFAWFGDLTAFKGGRAGHTFLPSNRRPAEGMTGILDIAPIINGDAADIGYCFVHGKNPGTQAVLDDMNRTLLDVRELILEGIRARRTFKSIYREVDSVIEAAGYINQHKRYPHRVLGHRVGRHLSSPLNKVRWLGFGLLTYVSLMSRQWASKLVPGVVHSPLWNDPRESDHRPVEGLWAVEPHVALPDQSLGAKWEEILVIATDNAWWRASTETAAEVFASKSPDFVVCG
ncbi:hypothetical protein WK66_08870 [Burkholderia ubonensis]|nr:hypothetical protein WK66_08870 [Burkholderia ubonensis]